MQDNTNNTNTQAEAVVGVDPIQEAYNKASYDLKKFLESDTFSRTVDLIIQANKVGVAGAKEANFICLMLALKIIQYTTKTADEVVPMLVAAQVDEPIAKQVWSDVEAYIIPMIPELGTDDHTNDGDMTVNRSVTLDPGEGEGITHFGPDSVEMRLKSIGGPRITLDQLSKGGSLLDNMNLNKSQHAPAKAINYDTHPDPYREEV